MDGRDSPSISQTISIAPLLKSLEPPTSNNVNIASSASKIASALALIFNNQLSDIQCASLLTKLESWGWDYHPQVLAACASRMRDAAAQVDRKALKAVVKRRGRKEGSYRGGLCDLVGTGGDGHSTFNVSTTSSILASALLLLAKHGNRSSSSTSGSADLLKAIQPKPPNIEAIQPDTLIKLYEQTNYAFLFAPIFHPGMKHVAHVRANLGIKTIFNLLGPLVNPVEDVIEARVVGVARRELGRSYAEALDIVGAKKAMVVCGAENLDEISCAGKTYCWRLSERPNPAFNGPKTEEDEEFTTSDEDAPPRNLTKIETFELEPSDFGLPTHPLASVAGGKLPHENAEILMQLLKNELPRDHPILDFVLINTAALFVISGLCDAEIIDGGHADRGEIVPDTGPGGGKWKEGVRRARWTIESGQALKSLEDYIKASNNIGTL